jgi:hypothetical protein
MLPMAFDDGIGVRAGVARRPPDEAAARRRPCCPGDRRPAELRLAEITRALRGSGEPTFANGAGRRCDWRRSLVLRAGPLLDDI